MSTILNYKKWKKLYEQASSSQITNITKYDGSSELPRDNGKIFYNIDGEGRFIMETGKMLALYQPSYRLQLEISSEEMTGEKNQRSSKVWIKFMTNPGSDKSTGKAIGEFEQTETPYNTVPGGLSAFFNSCITTFGFSAYALGQGFAKLANELSKGQTATLPTTMGNWLPTIAKQTNEYTLVETIGFDGLGVKESINLKNFVNGMKEYNRTLTAANPATATPATGTTTTKG